MEIAPIVHLIMDIVMDVGIMVMITRMDVNLVEIKAVDCQPANYNSNLL